MNKSLRIGLLVVGTLLAAALVFYTGFATGSNPRFNTWANTMFGGMLGSNGGYGMMGANGGYGMMGANGGYGMMGANGGYGMMGANGGYGTQVDPLSLEDAEQAVQSYLAELGVDGLSLGEIMIFDNHAYAQLVEDSSGIGAMEVLIDPVSLAVYPEHGPNMMWNLKYNLMGPGMMGSGYGMMGMMSGGYGMMGMMSGGYGMMGMMSGGYGMMGGFNEPSVYEGASPDLEISPDQAISLASQYLADNLPDYSAADEADAFYGYYTLHVLKDGEIDGMLSVNGFNGQVFLHTWHGEFIEMSHE